MQTQIHNNYQLNEQLILQQKKTQESQRNLQILQFSIQKKEKANFQPKNHNKKDRIKRFINRHQMDLINSLIESKMLIICNNTQKKFHQIFQVNSDNQSRNVVIYAPPPDRDRNPFVGDKIQYSQELLQLENKIKQMEKQLIREKELEKKKQNLLIQQVQPEEHQNFDFLTNYNQLPVIEQEEFSQEYSNEQSTEKNKISRKTSGNISSQNNSISKNLGQNIKLGIIGQNRPKTQQIIDKYSQEHQLRVITKEGTPFISNPLINKIKSRKDLATLQVQSYLNDYSPFLQGNLDGIPYNSQKLILQKFAQQQQENNLNFNF